jgi:hypothetical protein
MRCTLVALFGLLVGIGGAGRPAPAEEPEKLSINRIMLLAHLTPQNRGTHNNLDNKVLDKKATEAEKKELMELYTALGKLTPPKGKPEDWKVRTDELVAALKAVYADEEKAAERFLKARDCKACHMAHRMAH